MIRGPGTEAHREGPVSRLPSYGMRSPENPSSNYVFIVVSEVGRGPSLPRDVPEPLVEITDGSSEPLSRSVPWDRLPEVLYRDIGPADESSLE